MSERINDKIKLKTEEAKTLKDLEELIGKSIPQMGTKNSPPFSPFGVTIENEHVIELNLGYPNLHGKARYSKLAELPESIGNLTSLTKLFILGNQLTILPESIGNLESLIYLNLRSNRLRKLPESIGNLKSLRMCEVDDNLLKNIPKSVLELKSLYLSAGSCRIHKQESNIRRDIMNEYKKNVIPAHTNGTYLEKLNEEELRERKIEKKRRREELYLVEKALKDKQVKFVVNVAELEDIKKHARIFRQTQSEFIRTAIRDKIRLIDVQDQDLEKPRENQEDRLILEKLNKIQEALDRIESKEKTD